MVLRSSLYSPPSARIRWNRLVVLLGLVFLSCAWVLPNKNSPWLSAWNEGLAFLSAGILSLAAMKGFWFQDKNRGISWQLLTFCISALLVVWVQWFSGLLVFQGDAWLVTLYMGFFLLSVQTGSCLTRDFKKNEWVDGFMGAVAIAGLLTVAMSMIQWTATYDFVIFVQEIGNNGRPFANLGQINHVNTLCFIAGCAVLQLHAHRKIHGVVLVGALVVLSFGMALTQSRTAVIQIIALWIWSAWQFRSLNPLRNSATVLILAYIIWVLAIPALASAAFLEPGRPIQLESNANNLRLRAWAAMLDAMAQRPWTGYGWLQNSWAQQVTAHSHPGLRYEFNYAHNFVVDLLIWVGLPLGIMMTLVLISWAWRHAKSRNPEITFLAAALLGIMVHGLLEYPLAYAYFLVPAGLLMGSMEALNPVIKIKIISRWIIVTVWNVLVFLLFGVGIEYAKAVEADTRLRTETLRIGVAAKKTQPPHLVLLDQMGSQLQFRFVDPSSGMSEEQMALMERVAMRYATLPVLTDVAYAKHLNGEKSDSDRYLDIACAIYGENVCERNIDSWPTRKRAAAGRLDIYAAPLRSSGGYAPSQLPALE